MGCVGSTRKMMDCTHDEYSDNKELLETDTVISIDRKRLIPQVMSPFMYHATMVWVGIPLLVGVQAIPGLPLMPDCEDGFHNLCFIVVLVIVVASHCLFENEAWYAVKRLCTPPELTILKNLGVLRRRRNSVIIGLLEDLDIYTDMLFPLVAFSCDSGIQGHWDESWHRVRLVGPVLHHLSAHVHFWSAALVMLSLNWSLQLISLCRMAAYKVPDSEETADGAQAIPEGRVTGKDFIALAQQSETAVMPSVAMLCEEMANQKKWMFRRKNSRLQESERQKLVFGKEFDYDKVLEMEGVQMLERERVERASRLFMIFQMVVRIIIGHALQLWVQSSFLMYAFKSAGMMAKAKVVFGMGLSVIQITSRTLRATSGPHSLGAIGHVLNLICLVIIVWTAAKVYHAFSCPDHLWGVTTGCIDMAAKASDSYSSEASTTPLITVQR